MKMFEYSLKNIIIWLKYLIFVLLMGLIMWFLWLRINIINQYSSLITLVVAVITLIYLYYQHKNNQKNLFLSLLKDLNQIARSSESYKYVIVQSIKNEISGVSDGDIVDYIKSNFSDYLDGELVEREKIQEKIRQDKEITKKINNFGIDRLSKIFKLHIDGKDKDLPKNILTLPLIPQHQINQIEYGLYSKNIDFLTFPIFGKSTSTLKDRILELKNVIDVINFQVSKLNDVEFLPRTFTLSDEDEQSEERLKYLNFWHRYYYQVCRNIATLDSYIYGSFNELSKFIKINKEDIEFISILLNREAN